MARKIRFRSQELFFPDYYSDDQILDIIDSIKERESLGEAQNDLGQAFHRGLAKGLPGIARLGAGAVGLAGDVADLIPGVEGAFDDTEQAIRDAADEATVGLGGKSVQDVSDTFLEKVSEAGGKAPGIALEFAPTMALPLGEAGAVAKGAARFGAHGLLSEGGHGLGQAAAGGLRGATEGALFSGIGKAVSGIPSEVGRRIGHAVGTAGAITGIGTAYGAPLEESLAEGIGMGAYGLLGGHGDRAKLEADRAAYKKVMSRADELMKETKGLDRNEALKLAAKEAEANLLEDYEPKSEEYRAATFQHRQKETEWVDGKLKTKEKLEPMYPEDMNLQPAFNNIRVGEVAEAVKEVPDKFVDEQLRHDPMTFKKHYAQYEALNPTQRRDLSKSMGMEVTEHNFVKMQYLAKEMLGEISVQIDHGKQALDAAMATGDPKRIGAAEVWLNESRQDFENTLATFVGLGREWKHAGKARAAIMAKAEVGERALMTIAKNDKLGRLSPEMIDAIREDPSNWKAAHDAINASMDSRTSDYVYEVWINGLLSGPPTHAVNFISNAITQVLNTVERGIAPAADITRYVLEGGKTPRERYISEFVGDTVGWYQGIKKGLPVALRMARDESFMQEVPTTLEGAKQHTIGGGVGQAIRLPSSILRASDWLFKAIASQREGYAQAYRLAAKEGLKGEARSKFIQEVLDDPSTVMIEQMGKASRGLEPESIGSRKLSDIMKEAQEIQTFTNPLGVAGRRVLAMKRDIPALRWVIPFVRTPANILKYGIKRTPLGLIDTMKKFGEYKRGKLDAGALADSAAASLLGTTIAAVVVQMAKEGFITGGGPADWNEQLNKRKTGWQPYSVRNPFPVGPNDQWLSYSRVEPLAIIMGMAADFQEAKDSDELDAEKIVTAIKENLTNKTFLVGLENLAKAWGNPDQFLSQYFKTMVGSAVPAVFAQATNVADPYSRMTEAFGTTDGVPDAWAARIPGMSEKLPVRYDATGQPLERMQRAGRFAVGEDIARGLSPFSVSKIDPTRKLERNMDALSSYEGVPPPMPKRTKHIPIAPGRKKKIKLTDMEYGIYMENRRKATDVLRRIVDKPDWDMKPAFVKAKIISSVYRKFDSAAGNKVNLLLRQRLKN